MMNNNAIPDTSTVIESIVNQMPLFEGFKINYEVGSKESFDTYIANKTDSSKYPIIWEVLPSKMEVIEDNIGKSKVVLIIAIKSSYERSRDYTVIRKEFDSLMMKLLNRVVEGLKKSSATTMLDSYFYEKKPNYYENNKSVQLDILNVIVFEANIQFKTTNCLNTIIWE